MKVRCESVVQKADAALRLPVGRRTRVLLEISQDLEDLSAAYRARGMSAAEAHTRATQVLGLGPESLSLLNEVHAPWWSVIVKGFSGQGVRRLERTMLGLLTAGAATLGVAMLRIDSLWRASPLFAAAMLTVFSAGAMALGAAGIQMKRRSAIVRWPMQATSSIAGIAALLTALGLLAAVLQLSELALQVELRGALHWAPAMRVLGDAAMLLTCAMSGALLILLGWLPLYRAVCQVAADTQRIIDADAIDEVVHGAAGADVARAESDNHHLPGG